MYKKYGALSSSVDPSQLSTTVEGIIQLVASLLVFGGFLTVAESTTLLSHVNQLITDVLVLIPLVSSMWGLCVAIFGALRKVVVAIGLALGKKTITLSTGVQTGSQPV